jgi:hypothetical protein
VDLICLLTFKLGDKFLLLDCGGGTVDAATYSVKGRVPNIQIAREEAMPDGRLCGSSFINERFREHVKDILKEEDYLNLDEVIEGETVMHKFEYSVKRGLTFNSEVDHYFFVAGLRDDINKEFCGATFRVSM